jgi:glycosyltransferase involved in cell wall biosynthesis
MSLIKNKVLFILHKSPPSHGAAMVGDFIASSTRINSSFESRFISIESSRSIDDIGKLNFRKIYLAMKLYVKVLSVLVIFRPQKIYFTASIRGVAFYRDLLVSILWKTYGIFKIVEVYCHYHTKGVDIHVSKSKKNLKLTCFFVKNVNLILLSPLLKDDFDKVRTYNQMFFLPNGVKDILGVEDFDMYISRKYTKVDKVNILYLAHMMRDKGYDKVLELAQQTKGQNIYYHFAGSWGSLKDKDLFNTFIAKYKLGKYITFHGFVSGVQKHNLFKKSHILVYPSRNDAFPLTLLESLSYGIPVVATNEGSISSIVDQKSGVILDNTNKLYNAIERANTDLVNIDTAQYCRQRYIEKFTTDVFEKNFISILNGK